MGNIMYIPEVNEKTEVGCNLIKNTECGYNFMEDTEAGCDFMEALNTVSEYDCMGDDSDEAVVMDYYKDCMDSKDIYDDIYMGLSRHMVPELIVCGKYEEAINLIQKGYKCISTDADCIIDDILGVVNAIKWDENDDNLSKILMVARKQLFGMSFLEVINIADALGRACVNNCDRSSVDILEEKFPFMKAAIESAIEDELS